MLLALWGTQTTGGGGTGGGGPSTATPSACCSRLPLRSAEPAAADHDHKRTDRASTFAPEITTGGRGGGPSAGTPIGLLLALTQGDDPAAVV
jgi:hypothetical protein